MNRFGIALLAASTLVPCLPAVETQSWIHNEREDFNDGTLVKLSLRSDGRLILAPVFKELADPSIAYLWALAVDSRGTLYAGGGGPNTSQARLVSVDPAGKLSTVAEVPGLQIQALAVDNRDRIYAATAPDGKVYRIERDGKFEVFYDPEAKYIWALAFDSGGRLYVATGDGGEVHRVLPDGKGEVFFRTEETHARSLALDREDNVLVGTEPGGLIIRVSPTGDGFVLYQGNKREVTSLAVAADGTVYAGAVGNKTGVSRLPAAAPSPSAPAVTSQVTPSSGTPARAASTTTQPAPAKPPVPPPAPAAVPGGSELYRIAPDGYPEAIWSHPEDVIYAIVLDRQGKPIVGTGNKGNIYKIENERLSTLLVHAAPTQVTALAAGPKGQVYSATGNVGKIFSIGPELEKQGSYESQALDAGSFSYWGRINSKAELHGGELRLESRSGNLDRPQNSWSGWKLLDAQTQRVPSPSARFLQYRVTLISAPKGDSPVVREVEIAYMPKNAAPELREVEITPANYRFNPPSPLITATSQSLTLPPMGQRTAPARSSSTLDTGNTSQTLLYSKGQVGARWLISDPNGDSLTFDVDIRGLGETEWKKLKGDVKERFITWDSSAFADGEYLLRVTASDSPSNPPDRALKTSLVSERFTVDNTPPEILNVTSERKGKQVVVRWTARDARSLISTAEYSLNGGDWTFVEPVGRLSDARELDYLLEVNTGDGEQTVAIRVADEFDNAAVAQTVVRR